MSATRDQFRQWFRAGAIMGILAAIGGMLLPGATQAADFTAEAVIGTAETANATAIDWQKLVEQMLVETGHFVRTDVGASVELRGEDGSLLFIAEATQLLIKEFTFEVDQQVRVAKFAVLQGTVTADAAHLAYATNVFEIETPTVLASFKFSKLIVQVDAQGNTTLIPLSGRFEFRRIGTTGWVEMRHTSRRGVETTVDLPGGGKVGVESTEAGATITNTGDASLNVTIGGKPVTLPPGTDVDISPTGTPTKGRKTSRAKPARSQETTTLRRNLLLYGLVSTRGATTPVTSSPPTPAGRTEKPEATYQPRTVTISIGRQ